MASAALCHLLARIAVVAVAPLAVGAVHRICGCLARAEQHNNGSYRSYDGRPKAAHRCFGWPGCFGRIFKGSLLAQLVTYGMKEYIYIYNQINKPFMVC